MLTRVAPARNRPGIMVLSLFLLVPLSACEQKKETTEEPRKQIKEEVKKEIKLPIGLITTTNYCLKGFTAADVKAKPGHIALSRDIVKKHKLKFGDAIYLEGEDEPYEFMDTMPPKWHRHADLFSRKCKTAREYGVKNRRLWVVRKDK